MGAGILPYAIQNGQLYVLLGRERVEDNQKHGQSGLWSDFGGKKIPGEETIETAAREAFEESDGLLGSKVQIIDTLRSGLKSGIVTESVCSGSSHVSYLLEIPFNSTLPTRHYQRFQQAWEKNRLEVIDKFNGKYEKDRIAWFHINHTRRVGCALRPWYGRIFQGQLDKLAEIGLIRTRPVYGSNRISYDQSSLVRNYGSAPGGM